MPGEAIQMAPDGELIIPASLSAALGMKEGGVLLARGENGSLHLEPPQVTSHREQESGRSEPQGQ